MLFRRFFSHVSCKCNLKSCQILFYLIADPLLYSTGDFLPFYYFLLQLVKPAASPQSVAPVEPKTAFKER